MRKFAAPAGTSILGSYLTQLLMFFPGAEGDANLLILGCIMAGMMVVAMSIGILERISSPAAKQGKDGHLSDLQFSHVTQRFCGVIKDWFHDPSTKLIAWGTMVLLTAWWAWREYYWAFIFSSYHAAVTNEISTIHEHQDVHRVYSALLMSLAIEAFIGIPSMWVVDPMVHFYCQIRFRDYLTRRALCGYFSGGGQAYYHIKLGERESGVDNPDQRIAEDIPIMSDLMERLVSSVLSTLFGFTFWSTVIFGIGGTRLVKIAMFFALLRACVALLGFGRRLVLARHQVLVDAAHYRYGMTRIRDSAEEIALGGGDEREFRHSYSMYDTLVRAVWTDILVHLRYGVSMGLLDKLPSILLWLSMLPLLVKGDIHIGDALRVHMGYEQAGKLFGFVADNFSVITDFQANVTRFVQLMDVCDNSNDLSRAPPFGSRIAMQEVPAGAALVLDKVTIWPPGPGRAALATGSEGVSLICPLAAGLLIMGPSGVGKSSLLRAVAGLWTQGAGVVRRPGGPSKRHIHFLPSKCYFPMGTLKQAVCYPNDVATEPAAVLLEEKLVKEVLLRAKLSTILSKWGLEDPRDWRSLLSSGEQQRLAFARLFFQLSRCTTNSELAVLDEATGAVDTDLESDLYKELCKELLLGRSLKGFVSVAHRPRLTAFHENLLLIGNEVPDGIDLNALQTTASGIWTGPGNSQLPWKQYSQDGKTKSEEIV